jgi:hypothetical protein
MARRRSIRGEGAYILLHAEEEKTSQRGSQDPKGEPLVRRHGTDTRLIAPPQQNFIFLWEQRFEEEGRCSSVWGGLETSAGLAA